MANVSYKLKDLEKRTIKIGYVGENDHMHVLIDCKEVFDEYPAAVPTMAIVPPEGEDYPKAVTRNGNIVEWLVKNSDVAAEGDGEFQLTFTEDNVVKKSVTGRFSVERSISGNGTAPSGIDDFLTDANEKLAAVVAATQEAEDAASHAPRVGTSGYWETWDAETEQYVSTGTKAQGEQGDPGSPGDPTQLIDDTAGQGTTGKTWSAGKIDGELADVKNAIHGVDDEMDDAVFFEETQDDDSIEEIIKSEIIDKMEFSISGVNLSIVYDGTVVDTVQLPSAQPVPCTGVALDITVTALEAEKTVTLTATLTPSNTTDTVVWSTSDDTVATVNNGVVTGVAKGTATITVTCGSFSDTCTVTVTAYFRELVLGYLLAQTNRLDYRSSYGYVAGGTFNDPFLKKVTSGQKVSLKYTSGFTSGLYVYMYVYDAGTFTDKCSKVGDDYVLTQAMLDMQSNDTYGILVSSTKLHNYGQYASMWEGDYTATQDCYVAFFYNINGSADISNDLDNIKKAIRIEVE